MTSRDMPFDHVGYWSEVKLDIIREYAAAYSKILSAQKKPTLEHIYIDAFAGAGVHVSRTSGEFVAGSPMNALLVRPPFLQYHFIDLKKRKVAALENFAKERADVQIYHGTATGSCWTQCYRRPNGKTTGAPSASWILMACISTGG